MYNLIEELIVVSLVLLFFGSGHLYANKAEKYLDQLALANQENKNVNSKSKKFRK